MIRSLIRTKWLLATLGLALMACTLILAPHPGLLRPAPTPGAGADVPDVQEIVNPLLPVSSKGLEPLTPATLTRVPATPEPFTLYLVSSPEEEIVTREWLLFADVVVVSETSEAADWENLDAFRSARARFPDHPITVIDLR